MLLAQTSQACPDQAPCAELTVANGDSPHQALGFAAALPIELTGVRPAAEFAQPETGVRSAGSDQPQMPWIWKLLRKTAYRHLPHKRIDRFDATFAPTVVSSGFDTVAGAGVQGRF